MHARRLWRWRVVEEDCWEEDGPAELLRLSESKSSDMMMVVVYKVGDVMCGSWHEDLVMLVYPLGQDMEVRKEPYVVMAKRIGEERESSNWLSPEKGFQWL